MKNTTNALQPVIDRIPEEWGKYTSVGEGWDEIILDLDKGLAEIDPNYVVLQCKEKFGGLRYYTEFSQDLSEEDQEKFEGLVRAAEKKSEETCESCGKPGRLRGKYWVYTACDSCEEEKKQ